jgi:hypothetical protein
METSNMEEVDYSVEDDDGSCEIKDTGGSDSITPHGVTPVVVQCVTIAVQMPPSRSIMVV